MFYRLKSTRFALLVVATLLVTLTLRTTLAWTWQATYYPFMHSQPFTGTVSSGQQDAAVAYENSNRNAYAEGSYLKWSQTAIDDLKNRVYCRYNYCNPKVWYEAASVFHAFAKNSGECGTTALTDSGWSYTNLPGAVKEVTHSGCEMRYYITNPAGLSASATYVSQMAYRDSAYPGTKSNGQINYSTYLVQVGSITPIPMYRDDNGKLCINNDSASVPTNNKTTC